MRWKNSWLLLLLILASSCAQRYSVDRMAIFEAKKSYPEIVYQKKSKLVILDAGHGGKDTGAHSQKDGYIEKQLTLSTTQLLRRYLQQMGYQTVLTRSDDTYIPLDKRSEIANSARAALFVSVHYNHCPNSTVDGIEVYYCKAPEDGNVMNKERLQQSRKLGEEVLAKVVKQTGATSRGVKTANFSVIKKTNMPAILVECGFLSHPKEREKLKDVQYRQFVAMGIAKGIDSFLSSQRR